MAVRTTEAAVKKICKVKVGIDLTPFMETASQVVDDNCLESEYSDAKLELLERWLTAHFYCTLKPRSMQESVKGVNVMYEGKTKIGLSNTRYGQQAMIIDNAGNLAALDDPKRRHIKGSITYIGGDGFLDEECEVID